MNLLKQIEALPIAAQRTVHSIAAQAGVVITEAGAVAASPLAYLRAQWRPLLIALALGIAIGAGLDLWA